MKRGVISLLALVLIITVFSGCSVVADTPDESDRIESPTEGLYILTSEGEYYRANTTGQNFTDLTSGGNPDRMVMTLGETKFIPKLYKDDMLVYFTTGVIPSSYSFERFRNMGYSAGIYGISMGSDGRFTFTNANLRSGSDAATVLGGVTGSTPVYILSINGEKPTPDMFSQNGCIIGYEQGESIPLEIMVGTHYFSVSIKADVHYWYSISTGAINAYSTTKNGYIILSLPEDFEANFVSFAGTGLVQIMNSTRAEEKGE